MTGNGPVSSFGYLAPGWRVCSSAEMTRSVVSCKSMCGWRWQMPVVSVQENVKGCTQVEGAGRRAVEDTGERTAEQQLEGELQLAGLPVVGTIRVGAGRGAQLGRSFSENPIAPGRASRPG